MAPGSVIDDGWMAGDAATVPPRPMGAAATASLVLPIGASMADAQRQLMLATLRHCNYQRERTAALLGISLKTLYNWLKELPAEAATGGRPLSKR
jgi:DNA-binding NtrC family response regulator